MNEPFIFNFVGLYPEKHCPLCEDRVCDICHQVGWECLVDQDKAKAIAEERGIETIVQTFICRTCRVKHKDILQQVGRAVIQKGTEAN